MNSTSIRLGASILVACSFLFSQASEGKIKALIVDGQNNHDVWPLSTLIMKQYLEESGLFEVDIDRTRFTWRGHKAQGQYLPYSGIEGTEDLPKPKTDPDFKPSFAGYDVVISNFGNSAADWPEETRSSFEEYMNNGGGFVSVHAADNSFGKWDEYNQVIGIGGWGGRKGDRPGHAYVYYTNEGELVRDESLGGRVGAHGGRHSIPVTVRQPEHPIMKGLPNTWLTGNDECYARLRGPAENLTILATGDDQTEKAPTDRHEPLLMVIDYGKGRTFHTTLGHDVSGFECVGFITTFLRGTEWAATGRVTIPVPSDFPTAEKPISRTFELNKELFP